MTHKKPKFHVTVCHREVPEDRVEIKQFSNIESAKKYLDEQVEIGNICKLERVHHYTLVEFNRYWVYVELGTDIVRWVKQENKPRLGRVIAVTHSEESAKKTCLLHQKEVKNDKK